LFPNFFVVTAKIFFSSEICQFRRKMKVECVGSGHRVTVARWPAVSSAVAACYCVFMELALGRDLSNIFANHRFDG
jgi:hypothetical protein